MIIEIENHNGKIYTIVVHFTHSFKGRGSWNIECTVTTINHQITFKHHTTNSQFIDEINDLKSCETYENVQNRYFNFYFEEFKENILEQLNNISQYEKI